MQPPHDAHRSGTAILLDVDGTLVDSNDAHARAWVDAFAEAGIPVDFDEVRRAIGMGGDKLMPRVSGLSDESPEGSRISERRREIFKTRYLPQLRAFPEVRALVERLKDDGHMLVVASSAKRDELGALLDRAGVADLIEARTSSDDAEESKPDPDIVSAALRQAGVPARAAVLIGDTPYDVQAGTRAGVRVVAVECGGWRRQDLAGAAEVYASPADLHARYESSLLARLKEEGPADDERPWAAPALMMAFAFVALGTFMIVRELAGHRPAAPIPDPDAGTPPHAGLGPRERAELRELISRTS